MSNEQVEGEVVEATEVAGTALATIMKAEIDTQITTAQAYPRSITSAKNEMLDMVKINADIAASCGYALARSGKRIVGPSVRLAEIAAECWGNIRVGARVIEVTQKEIVAQGFCHDVQKNVMVTMEVRRRITNKEGRRFSDDMVIVTANAACAIAKRNAIFNVVPRSIIDVVYAEAMKTASGGDKPIGERRKSALDAFAKLGVTKTEVMTVLDKPAGGAEDIAGEDLEFLRGLLVAIKDGEQTVDEIFRPAKTAGSGEADALNEKLKQKQQQQQTTPVVAPVPSTPAPSQDPTPVPQVAQDGSSGTHTEESGVDAGAAQPDGEAAPQPVTPEAQPASEKTAIEKHQEFIDTLKEFAGQLGVGVPSPLNKQYQGWLLSNGLKGKDQTMTDQQREKCLADLKAGNGAFKR